MPDRFIFTEPLPAVPGTYELRQGDALECLREIPDSSVRCIITSPPYFRKFSYGCGEGEHGLEKRADHYIFYHSQLAEKLRRVCTPDANLFIVIQDSYNYSGSPGGDHRDSATGCYLNCRGPRENNIPRKAQLLIPEWLRVTYGLAGWIPTLRIVWNKEDARRGAVDRPSYSYEEILVFAASPQHYWNREAVLTPYSPKSLKQLVKRYKGVSRIPYSLIGMEDPSDAKRRMITGMNRKPGAYLRAVWRIPPTPQPTVYLRWTGEFVRGIACFPLLLAEILVNIGSEPGDTILDPFMGMGTTIMAACKWGRNAKGIELGEKWIRASRQRLGCAGYTAR